MTSLKLASKSTKQQQPLKFVVGTKNVNDIAGPILASFGDFPALESIDPNGEDPLLFSAYAAESKKKLVTTKNATTNDNNIFDQQYFLKGETSTTEYFSSTQNSKRANQSKYLVGIFDPSKNEVELVPTPGIFMVEQATKNVKLFFETPEEDSRKRSARSLQVFGATGAKNLSKRMTMDSLHDGTGNVTEGMVEDLKQRLTENPDNLREGIKIDFFADLPSPDTETREVTAVYDATKLIPDTIWPHIPRINAKSTEVKITETHHLHPITLKLLKHPHFEKATQLPNKILKERLVVYAACIAALKTTGKRQFKLNIFESEHRFVRLYVEHMFATFGISKPGADSWTFGNREYIKIALYGAVALLLAFDLSLDNDTLEDFGQLFYMRPEEVKVAFTRVGCTVTKTGAQLIDPWKVWADSAKRKESIEQTFYKARRRAAERIKANQQKEAEEEAEEEAAADVDPNVMNIDDDEPAQEESGLNDNDEDFVSGTKSSEKKRSRKSVGEKPKENPLNKKKKM